jgi:hypothetical protein
MEATKRMPNWEEEEEAILAIVGFFVRIELIGIWVCRVCGFHKICCLFIPPGFLYQAILDKNINGQSPIAKK